METILLIISAIALFLTVFLTLFTVVTFRKPRLIRIWGKMLSVLISFTMLILFILLSGIQLNPWVGIPIFLIGLILGAVRGLTVQLSYQNDQVVARGSWFFLLIWGLSWIFAQLLNFFGSFLLSSIGLIPVFLSTGIQVGLDGILILRRIMISIRNSSRLTTTS